MLAGNKDVYAIITTLEKKGQIIAKITQESIDKALKLNSLQIQMTVGELAKIFQENQEHCKNYKKRNKKGKQLRNWQKNKFWE